MHSNLNKNIQLIVSTLSQMGKLPKLIIQYGLLFFILFFTLGTALLVFHHTRPEYDAYAIFTATTLIKNSFVLLAEAVVGGLLIDFVFKK